MLGKWVLRWIGCFILYWLPGTGCPHHCRPSLSVWLPMPRRAHASRLHRCTGTHRRTHNTMASSQQGQAPTGRSTLPTPPATIKIAALSQPALKSLGSQGAVALAAMSAEEVGTTAGHWRAVVVAQIAVRGACATTTCTTVTSHRHHLP